MTSLSKPAPQNTPNTEDNSDWTLTTEQMIFMLENNNAIAHAYYTNDIEALRRLAASGRYKAVFDNMSWDEAFDRYLSAILD